MFAIVGEQAVFVEPKPLFDGPLAQHNVVLLGAGEVHPCGPERLLVDHAQIDLHAAFQPNRTLGFTGGEDLLDAGHLAKRRAERGGVRGCGKNVDIADRVQATAK